MSDIGDEHDIVVDESGMDVQVVYSLPQDHEFVFFSDSTIFYMAGCVFTSYSFSCPIVNMAVLPHKKPLVVIFLQNKRVHRVALQTFHGVQVGDQMDIFAMCGGFQDDEPVVFLSTISDIHIVNSAGEIIMSRPLPRPCPTQLKYRGNLEIYNKPFVDIVDPVTLIRFEIQRHEENMLDYTSGAVLYQDGFTLAVRPDQNDSTIFKLPIDDFAEQGFLYERGAIAVVFYQNVVNIYDVGGSCLLHQAQTRGKVNGVSFSSKYMFVAHTQGFTLFKLIS